MTWRRTRGLSKYGAIAGAQLESIRESRQCIAMWPAQATLEILYGSFADARLFCQLRLS